MVRFVHTSDWQIGMKGAGLGAAGARIAEQRVETIDRVLEIAAAEGAAFVVACGDLFEDNHVDGALVERVAEILGGHRSLAVHAIPGNHDVPGPGSVWNRPALRGCANLHLHATPGPVEVRGGEVTLHPFPVISRYASSDPLAQLEDLHERSGIQVALAHGHVTTIPFGAHEGGITLPIDPSHVARCGLDYLALGHWHGTRVLDERVAYSGTHEQTAYGETDAGNVLLVEIEAKGATPRVRPVRCGALAWRRDELTFAADTNLDRLRRLLAESDAQFLQVTLAGELATELHADLAELVEEARARFVHLQVREGDVRWRAPRDTAAGAPVDAGLAEVQAELIARLAHTEGEAADVLREALGMFRGWAREAGA